MKERVQKTLGAQFGLRWMLWLLFAVTCMIGLIACSYAYQQRRSALLQELDLRLQRVASEYENLVDDFWSLYISVFSHQEDMLFFYRYFDQPSTEPLASEEKVVLHPRIGLPQEMGYLSEAFFQAIEWAVREAERLGMQVILYDEGMYPSGSACGQVVAANPAFASRGIDWVPQPEEGDQVLAATPQGVLVSRFTRGTIRGIHFGEDDGEPGAPPSTDLLNPDAVDLFIRLTHEAYYRRLKPWFGGTIIAFFTDEPSIMGRDPRTPFAWTPGLEKEFTAAGGVLADLAALFRGEENPSTRLYHQMILEKEGSVYYRRLSEWCAGHGIALVGHPHRSDDIEVERWFQIPGQDLALRWVAPRHHAVDGIDSTMGHCSANAALLMGCRRNANECFGACNRDGNPWQLSGGDIKWYLDWLSVRGVNLFIPHAFYYSIEGPRKEERPPDVGPHSIWWGHYTLWSDYMRRLSALLTDAEVLVRVALPCRNRDLHPEIAAALQQAQIGYCYLPESVWPGGSAAPSACPGGAACWSLPAARQTGRRCLCSPGSSGWSRLRFVWWSSGPKRSKRSMRRNASCRRMRRTGTASGCRSRQRKCAN